MRSLICLLAMVIVGALSCISQPDFSDLYTGGLGFLPLTDSIRTFLVNHYKIGHSVLYSLLTVVFFYSLKKYQLLLAPLLAFTFGLTMELIQFLIPTRSNSFIDLGYNSVGIVVAVILLAILKQHNKKEKAYGQDSWQ